jgi:acetylglutamate kinase
VAKIGGNIIDDSNELKQFLTDLLILKSFYRKISDKMAKILNLIDGRRITDAPMLDVAVMIYAGQINKKYAQSQAHSN